MELYFTDHLALQDAVQRELITAETLARFEALSVPDAMPFFLEGDGTFPAEANAFLRNLPTDGNHSPNSWRAVAHDMITFDRFMTRSGRGSIVHASFRDLKDFKTQRRGGPNRSPEIQASSWNRIVYSLEKYFDYLAAQGLIAVSPFKYKRPTSRLFWRQDRGINSLLEPVDEDGEEIKCISMKDYLTFRDIGLRGLGTDRLTSAADARGHNEDRNALIADFMLLTGARVSETAAALLAEIPISAKAAGAPCTYKIANAVAKRLHGRRIYLGSALLDGIQRYLRVDRANAVLIGRERGAYLGKAWLRSVNATGEGCRVAGRRLAFADADPLVRRRLLICDNEQESQPASLWLSHDGLPLTDGALRGFFHRASKRCQKLGFDIDVTPHVLRHTFAVMMLKILVDATIRRLDAGRSRGASRNERLWEEATIDPIRILQRMLGHRQVETTFIYLTMLEEVQDSIAEAFEQWNRDLDAVAAVELGGGAASA